MYIAMNRFRIAKGREQDFINVWKHRDSHLQSVPGFKQFNLLQGPSDDEATLFASHSEWESEEAFSDWTKSESFGAAHANAGDTKGIYLGHPKFEGFNVVLGSCGAFHGWTLAGVAAVGIVSHVTSDSLDGAGTLTQQLGDFLGMFSCNLNEHRGDAIRQAAKRDRNSGTSGQRGKPQGFVR